MLSLIKSAKTAINNKGTGIATIRQTAMLKGERTALNILQHMSGIATAVSKAVGRATPMPQLQTQGNLR